MGYEHLAPPMGKNNMGGFTQEAYFASVSVFTTIKGVMTTTNPGDSVTIDGPHVFAVGEGFVKVYTTLKTAKLAMQSVGELDGRAQKFEGEFFYPGTDKKAAEMAAKLKNDAIILLLKDPQGTVIQVGSKDLYCYVTTSWESSEIDGGRKGFIFKFEAYGNSLLFYPSAIEVKA